MSRKTKIIHLMDPIHQGNTPRWPVRKNKGTNSICSLEKGWFLYTLAASCHAIQWDARSMWHQSPGGLGRIYGQEESQDITNSINLWGWIYTHLVDDSVLDNEESGCNLDHGSVFQYQKSREWSLEREKKNNRIETEKKTINAKKTDYYKIFSILRKIIMIFHNLCLFLKTFYWGIVKRMVFALFIVETE